MAEASDMLSTILAVVIGGWQPGVDGMLERFSAGVSEGGAEMVTWVVQASTDHAGVAELVALAKAGLRRHRARCCRADRGGCRRA